jgi:group I intron endonuclease
VKNLVIYAIVNTVNGKRYVGQSRQGLARRKSEHVHRFNLGERDHKLYQAMRKHGLESFQFEVLCHARRPEYLDGLERHFIERFNCFQRGYNMTCGGDGVADETRAKLRAIFKGRKLPWAWKIVEARRRNGTFGGQYGRKGADSNLAKTYLVQMPDGSQQTVKGINQFCKEHGLSKTAMLHILSGRQRTHRGYSLLARFND